MLEVARAIVGVSRDVLRMVVSFLRSSGAIRAENLVLRKQLASYIERRIKPRRLDHTTRVSVALFTRLFDWRDTVVNVQPATIVRRHRLGWRIFWLEVQGGPTTNSARITPPDSPDGRRESVMGRGANCQ
jgi:hypothetical protein